MLSKNGSGARLPLGVFGLCLAVVAALWAVLIFDVERSRSTAVKQARSDASNLTMAFRENVRRTIGAIDQLMATIVAANEDAGDELRIPTWVNTAPLVREIGVQIAIAGPDGITAASTTGPAAPVDISDRAYFRYQLDPSAVQPYIGVPFLGPASGKWSIQITRRITRKDGGFGGVLVVSMDPYYFTQFFQDIDVGNDGLINLIGLDGIVRSRRSHTALEIGQNLSKITLFDLLKRSSSGSEVTHSVSDGVTRIYGYSLVPGYPLVVTVGLALDDVLAPTDRRRYWDFIIGSGLTIIILTLSWFLAHETRRRRQREFDAQINETVREQRALLDTALNNMRHGLIMFDRDRRAVVVNQSFVEMYRLSPEKATPGRTIREVLEQRRESGTFAGDVDDYIENQIFGGGTADRILDIPDGRSVRIVNRMKADGGWVSIHEDVTARVRMEQERDRNREFLDHVIDTVSVSIIVKDARTLRYVLVNRATEKWLGLRREDLIGKTALQIYDKETADRIEAHDRNTLESPSNYVVTAHPISTPRNGTRLISSSRIAIRNHDGEPQYILGVVEDVTERKSIEDQLRQAQKMEAIGQLTGGIAHDFNNMLTVITGSIDILIEGVADKPELAEIARMIGEAADRAAELTGHLLSYARRQPLRPRATDINALTVELKRLLRPTLGEQIEIETILRPDLWPALVDPGQLSTALLNLAINARDAMPKGGKLTFETGNIALDESDAKSSGDIQPGNYVFIAVSDTGLGIAEEYRDRIFEPFFTTKEVGKGSGLGLSMVYGFIKQSGGDIKVYSEHARGTTFKIYLPRAEAQAPSIVASASDAQVKRGNETIFLVEDDALVRVHVTAQINSLGYKTLAAANAAEALAIADRGAQFDLLFTDVIMPGSMNGRQLADEMAKRRSGLKVLFTSGYDENAVAHHGRLDPGVLLLAKPYRKSELARMLRFALDGTDALLTRHHELQ